MNNSDILIRLRNLHEELADINSDRKLIEQVDDDTIDALGQLVTDAGAILDRCKDQPDRAAIDPAGPDLLDRIFKFETEHPAVARMLSQVTDVLAMMGI